MALQSALDGAELPPSATIDFGGEAQDQMETMTFLARAFIAAIVLMFMILVLQFNNFYRAFAVMSAIVFSIAGVLLGLIVTGRPFGILMGGVGSPPLQGSS